MTLHQHFRFSFAQPQVIYLLALLVGSLATIYFFGGVLAPVLASIVIAYLLEGLVAQLERLSLPRLAAVLLVFVAFLTVFVLVQVSVLPLLLKQGEELSQQIPTLLSRLQDWLSRLPAAYPQLVSEEEIRQLISSARSKLVPEVVPLGQQMISFSFNSLGRLIVNLFLIPFLVFFFLKDKELILAALSRFFPSERGLLHDVWQDVNQQIGNYLRGKFIEVLVIWSASGLTFALLGLRVPILMGALVGISVLVPYLGVLSMTVPVAVVAYLQWGMGSKFLFVMIAYVVIQLIDGNILSPLLLSEVVQLHPIVVVLSILLFGALWGFWGVVFAVPLATLVRAVFRRWPMPETEIPEEAQAHPKPPQGLDAPRE